MPPPPVRHPLPYPWRRLAFFWGAPTMALALLATYVGSTVSRPRCTGGNEMSAISTLRNISSCQAQFQAAAHVDEDGDGIGEPGGFLEMSGKVAPRGRDAPIRPPVLSGAFRTLTASGEVGRSGYLFRMYLVGTDGTALGEVPRVGFDEGEADPDACEQRWICYAWPAVYDHSGSRTFVITEAGDIFGTDCAGYSGESAPRPGAALLPVVALGTANGSPCCGPPDPLDLLDAALADGVPARDGNVWRKIN